MKKASNRLRTAVLIAVSVWAALAGCEREQPDALVAGDDSESFTETQVEGGATVNGASLKEVGLVKYADRPVKLLGRGKVEKTLTVEVAKASKSAVAAVEAAGGSVTVAG